MTTRREFLYAGAVIAPGLMLTDPVFAALAHPQVAAAAPASGQHEWPRRPEVRLLYNFNQNWRFYREDPGVPAIAVAADHRFDQPNDNAWETVNLPHTVRLEPMNASGGRNFQGICWYTKHFATDGSWRDRVVYLKFQGAMQVADVWLNGQHLYTNYCGYLPFTLDITQSLQHGEQNVLTLRLNNEDNPEVPPGKPQDQLDFVYFGGLYRSVELIVLDPVHITDPILRDQPAGGGIFVTVPSIEAGRARIAIRTEVANAGRPAARCMVLQELYGPNGELAARVEEPVALESQGFHTVAQQIDVLNPLLWHPEHPHLYVLHTSVLRNGKAVDDQYTRVGIKRIAFDRETGLTINGEHYFSVGANRHQDHPYVGYALSASAHYKDVKKLREAGLTSYRSHYPQDPAFMDACDELGVLAIVSNPGWQFMGDDVFRQRAYKNAQKMVRRDRNHACVLLWEAQMNETDNSTVAAELYRIVHEEYPSDQAYAAGDRVKKTVPGFSGWDVQYSDNRGQKPEWNREWGDLVDNWTDQQGPNRVARGWGEGALLSQVNIHFAMLDRIFSGQKEPVTAEHARVSGAGLWAGIDAYRGYHHQPFLGGPLDLFRIPKFDYYMFQSQRAPVVSTDLPSVQTGPMVFIASYATFQSSRSIIVFSNCEQVRVTQNGKEVGTQSPEANHSLPHPWFLFNVSRFSQGRSMLFGSNVAEPNTEVGEVRAEGLIGGKVVATYVQLAPGTPTQIKLVADLCGRDLVADGGDWMRVYAHVCDARGATYPYGDDLILFSVAGEGEIIGDATIGANPVRADAGIATALIRSNSKPGTITVRATGFGLSPAEQQIKTVPLEIQVWPSA
jgi:beta-galactosidase